MPVTNVLFHLLQNKFNKLSKVDLLFLEANLFARLSEEFSGLYRKQYKTYLQLLKNEPYKDYEMIENNFLQFVVNDIVSTNEYTLEGIANEVKMPVDAVMEVVSGLNTNPSLLLASRIIRLHCDIRKDLYGDLIKKVMEDTLHYDSSKVDNADDE